MSQGKLVHLNKSVLISGLFLAMGLVISAVVLVDMARHATRPRQSAIPPTTQATLASIRAGFAPSQVPSPTSIPIPTPTPLPPTKTPTPRASPTQVSESSLSVTPAAPDATSTPTPTGTSSPTATPSPPPARSSTPTTIPSPAATPTPSPTDAPTFTPTPTPTSTSVPPGRIQGRLLLGGAPVAAGVILKVENQAYTVVAQARTGPDGRYAFTTLPASNQGYNLLFAQEWNVLFDIEEAISWGWLGPVALAGGETVDLPDLDVSLDGLRQASPAPNAARSAAALSPEHPLRFEWTIYPGATGYWVDLAPGEALEPVWQSALVTDTAATFDGLLGDGARIEPGEYWWGVGARRPLGPYTLTVYGYQQRLVLEP